MAKSANNLNSVLQDTADAIRTKTSGTDEICPRDFADEIDSIETGITPTGTINITSNGTHDVANYASASVSVSPVGILQYPSPSAIVSGATAKTKKDQQGDMFQWLYVASDWSPNAMNDVSMMVSNYNEDEYLVFKFGGNESQCYFELWTAGTNAQGTDGFLIYKVYIPNGCYFKLPYWWTGNDSIKIVSVQSTGLWYNSKAYFVSAY